MMRTTLQPTSCANIWVLNISDTVSGRIDANFLIVNRVSKVDALSTAFGLASPFVIGSLESRSILGSPSERSLEIQFRARRNYLETFLPRVDSRIDSPGGWGKASWIVRHLQSTEWKGASKVTIVGLSIPNAILVPDQKEPEEFTPVIFCDSAEFVISAREELGLPVLLVDVKEIFNDGQYELSLGQSSQDFMHLQVNSSPKILNGIGGSGSLEAAKISVTTLESQAIKAILPGLANVIIRLQGLDSKELVVV